MAQPASARGASRRVICLFFWGLSGACATYEDAHPDDGGALGNGGSVAGGSAGTAPVGTSGGSAGSSAGSGGTKTGGAAAGGAAGMAPGMGGVAGSLAGAGGLSSGGTAGHAGTGGSGGAAGSGGKASGGGGAGGKASGGNAGSGGSGGSGGSVATQTCAKNPIPAKSKWVVTASSSSNADPATNAYDGVLTNRWSTGKDQVGTEWLQLDFGVAVTLTKLTLVLGASDDDYPRMYATRFSNTPSNQTGPILVSGMGAASTDTVMVFPAGTTGRYVLISQSGAAPALWWSVAEIQAECAD